MGVLDKFLCEISGGCAPEGPGSAPGISPADVARAAAALEQGAPPPTPAPSFAGTCRELWLSMAELKWADQAEQRFNVQGHALHFARDGSAPDIVLSVKTAAGEIAQLVPGSSLVGPFDGLTVSLKSRHRYNYEADYPVVRHDARLIVDSTPGAGYREQPSLRPRFRPVLLLSNQPSTATFVGVQHNKAAAPTKTNHLFWPAGFSRLLVRAYNSGATFGAAEVFDLYGYYPTLDQRNNGAETDGFHVWGDRRVTVNSANGLSYIAFEIENPLARGIQHLHAPQGSLGEPGYEGQEWGMAIGYASGTPVACRINVWGVE